MNTVVFEHVPIDELPEQWRSRLGAKSPARVTVRIEEELAAAAAPFTGELAGDPLFGMWRDREDMADVHGYIRRLRASRFSDDGTPHQG